jgi:hypothetical protein
MVIPAASTGKDIIKRTETAICAIMIKGNLKNEKISEKGNTNMVVTKFIDPKIQEAPARCKEKII